MNAQVSRFFISYLKKLILVVCLLSCAARSSLAFQRPFTPSSAQQKSVYSAIKDQYVRSIRQEQLRLSDDELDANKKHVSQDDYERLMFDIFATVEAHKALPTPPLPIASPASWLDLNLYCGSKNNPRATLLSKIDRCSTTMGKVVLARVLATPTTDIDLLTRRQNIIRKLVEDEGLYENLRRMLATLHATEHNLYDFWLAQADKPQNVLNINLYWEPFFGSEKLGIPPALWKQLNRSDTALSLNVIAKRTRITGAFFALLIWCKIIWDLKIQVDTRSNAVTALQQLAEEFSPSRMLGKFFQAPFVTAFEASNKMYVFYFFAILYYYLRDFKEDYIVTRDTLLDAHRRMNGLTAFIHTASLLHNSLSLFPELTQSLDAFENLTTLVADRGQNKEVNQLFSVLTHDRFKGKPRFDTFWSGPVLRAYKLANEVKAQFNRALEAIGEIDAYVSIATLLREHKSKGNPFSFAVYRKGSQPSLKFTQFWNPFVAADHAVANTLSLGEHGDVIITTAQNAILSGPNAGGKSTFMKGALYTALFAQTLTIVPAQYAELTPFSYLDSYISVEQDQEAGFSQFRAEVERAKEIIDNIRRLAPREFSFVVLDELFSGTNPLDATVIAQAVGEYVASFPNTLWIFATHFQEVTKLSDMTKGRYKNYKVLVNRNTDNSFAGYPFKIEEGITHESTALDVMRLAHFEKSIIARAEELKKLSPLRTPSH